MAVTYTNAVKTARMTATRDQVADGTLVILDGSTVLATHGLSATGGTIGGDPAAWTIVLDNTTIQASATGTPDGAEIRNAGGTAQVTGLTVGLSGADINFDRLDFTSGGNVTINSAVITHA